MDYDYENHFLQFQMTVDVEVKSGGEAKIHLEIQTHMLVNKLYNPKMSNLLDSGSKSVKKMTQARYKLKKDEWAEWETDSRQGPKMTLSGDRQEKEVNFD